MALVAELDLKQMSDTDLRKQQIYWQREFDQMIGKMDGWVITEMLHALEREAGRRGIDLG